VPSIALVVVGALFLVPSLLGFGGGYDEDDPLTGPWEGQGTLERYCVWSARIHQLHGGVNSFVYGPVEVVPDVSDKTCHYRDTYELRMSLDGTSLTRRAWGIPHTVEDLRRVD
jgi:hypothetical protein